MQALYFRIAAKTRTLPCIQPREAAMDRTHRPHIERRPSEDRLRRIGARTEETARSISAAQAEASTSGILRQLAEQMRHWD